MHEVAESSTHCNLSYYMQTNKTQRSEGRIFINLATFHNHHCLCFCQIIKLSRMIMSKRLGSANLKIEQGNQ